MDLSHIRQKIRQFETVRGRRLVSARRYWNRLRKRQRPQFLQGGQDDDPGTRCDYRKWLDEVINPNKIDLQFAKIVYDTYIDGTDDACPSAAELENNPEWGFRSEWGNDVREEWGIRYFTRAILDDGSPDWAEIQRRAQEEMEEEEE